MTLKNEIFEGIAAYKALAPTSQDRYYDLLADEARRKKKQDEEVEQGAAAAIAARQRPMGQVQTPTRASTAAPGTTPTTGAPTAFAPTAPVAPTTFGSNIAQGWRRGGRITKRYQDGGSVEVAEAERSDADRILQSVLRLKRGVNTPFPGGTDESLMGGKYVSQEPAEPQDAVALSDPYGRDLRKPNVPPVPERIEPTGQIEARAAQDQQRQREQISKQIGEPQPPEGDPQQTYRENIDRDMARVNELARNPPDAGAITLQPPERKTSWVRRNIIEPVDAYISAGGTGKPEDADPYYNEYPERSAARARARRISELREGLWTESTPSERAAKEKEIAELSAVHSGSRPLSEVVGSAFDTIAPTAEQLNRDAEARRERRGAGTEEPREKPSRAPSQEFIDQFNKDAQARRERRLGRPDQPPAEPKATAATPDVKPQATAVVTRPPGAGDPSVYGPVPTRQRLATGDPTDIEAPSGPYPSKTTPPAPTTRSTAGAGGGGGGTGGGGGGGGGAPGGTTGPGSGAGAVAPPPPRGRQEQTAMRTAAFEPGRERIDPTTGMTMPRELNEQGQVVYPTQQQQQSLVATAAQAGGVTPGGAAPPIGDGAVSRDSYRALVQEHNQGGRLTEGQALLVGMHAKFKILLKQGRAKEAATMAWGLIQAANLEAASLGMVARDQIQAGDVRGGLNTVGKALDLAPDGMRHRVVGNTIETMDQSGRVTSRTPVDGQRALALALGLSDGSLMWNVLQSAVQLIQPPDKNAEGRALRNDLTRLQIQGAQQRLQKLRSTGQGNSVEAQRLAALFGTNTASAPSGGGGGGSDDSSWIWAQPANTEPTEGQS